MSGDSEGLGNDVKRMLDCVGAIDKIKAELDANTKEFYAKAELARKLMSKGKREAAKAILYSLEESSAARNAMIDSYKRQRLEILIERTKILEEKEEYGSAVSMLLLQAENDEELTELQPILNEVLREWTRQAREKSDYANISNLYKKSMYGESLKELNDQLSVSSAGQQVQPSPAVEEGQDSTKDVSAKISEPSTATTVANSKAKKETKSSQASGASSPSPSVLNSMDTSNELAGSSNLEALFPQIVAMQEALSQLVSMQKEMQKQMSMMVAVPVTKEGRRVRKEGRRLEAALERSMEKAVTANNDALWARFQEENTKNEKLFRDRTQKITTLVNDFMNKDLPTVLEKTLKKELAAVEPTVVRTITPVIEKTIYSAISDSFQRGVGDKAVNQLEKSANSRLEGTVARQIQAQFQTSGRQFLQDLKSSFEALVIPAFELSCKAMFEQVDATFQEEISEHNNASLQHFETAHSPLALTLMEAINAALCVTQTLSGEVADGQRKLIALATSGANAGGVNALVCQPSNGPLGGLHEKIEVPLDPTKELSRLVSERRYEEAFTRALERSDVNIVSWLCSQVDLRGILLMVPRPLSQRVLLSLLQQLACDINNESSRKLPWMMDVAAAINPTDPMIAMHVRPIFEQVRQILESWSLGPSSDSCIMHVINCMLMNCK